MTAPCDRIRDVVFCGRVNRQSALAAIELARPILLHLRTVGSSAPEGVGFWAPRRFVRRMIEPHHGPAPPFDAVLHPSHRALLAAMSPAPVGLTPVVPGGLHGTTDEVGADRFIEAAGNWMSSLISTAMSNTFWRRPASISSRHRLIIVDGAFISFRPLLRCGADVGDLNRHLFLRGSVLIVAKTDRIPESDEALGRPWDAPLQDDVIVPDLAVMQEPAFGVMDDHPD